MVNFIHLLRESSLCFFDVVLHPTHHKNLLLVIVEGIGVIE